MITVGMVLEKKNNHLFTIKSDNDVQQALEIMAHEKISSLPVVDDGGNLIGIISERDYIRKAIKQRKAPWEFKVVDLMTKDVLSVTRQDQLTECMNIMSSNAIRHLPVMENENLVGIISITDVVRALRSARFVMD